MKTTAPPIPWPARAGGPALTQAASAGQVTLPESRPGHERTGMAPVLVCDPGGAGRSPPPAAATRRIAA